MFRVERFDHVEVYVRDLQRSIDWYREVLGLEVCYRWDPDPVMIGAGGTMLALFQLRPTPPEEALRRPPAPIRWDRVAWLTDEDGFRRAQEHLRRLRIHFRGPVDHRHSLSIYFKDPDGLPLEITYYIATATQTASAGAATSAATNGSYPPSSADAKS